MRGLEHPSHPRQAHPEPSHAPAWRRALTSMAKRLPSRVCSEPLSGFSDQCRCSCVARYRAASPPPAMEASPSSSTITGGHKRGLSPLQPPRAPPPRAFSSASTLHRQQSWATGTGWDGDRWYSPDLLLAPCGPRARLSLCNSPPPPPPQTRTSAQPLPCIKPLPDAGPSQGRVQTPQP